MALLFASVGAELTRYEIDVETGKIEPLDTVRLPSRVQEAWSHPSLPVLYAACANQDPDAAEPRFVLAAVSVAAGEPMRLHGSPAPVTSRATQLATDAAGAYLLSAYPAAPGVTVHELHADGTIGRPVPLPDGFDYSTYPHQIQVVPSGDRAILISRGHTGRTGTPAEAGTLRVLGYDDGQVTNRSAVDMTGSPGLAGFNPRHLDFHPHLPLVYVALEAQNAVVALHLDGDNLVPLPDLTRCLLADPGHAHDRQLAGTVHVHPRGTHLYVANRADGPLVDTRRWVTPEVLPVSEGGENSIAVFALDAKGVPELMQRVDTRGISARTFALDPSGRVLVAANSKPMLVETPTGRELVPASLAVFRVDDDGSLDFLRRYPVEVGRETLWWTGIA